MDKSNYSDRKENVEISKSKYSYRKKRRHYNDVIYENIIDPVCEDKNYPACNNKEDPNVNCDSKNDVHEDDFRKYLKNYLGQTITIFTLSGGESGSGFTGVIMNIECDFISLLTKIGPAPACALGNECNDFTHEDKHTDNLASHTSSDNKVRSNISSLGSVVIIPINKIAAFVHNAVGSSY